MNKEQALKLLLDSIEQDERFTSFEYEAIFVRDADGFQLDSDFMLYLDGTKVFTLSKEEICRKPEELILDTLLKRFYNVLTVEVMELKKVKEKEEALQKSIQLKEGRLERQKKKASVSESQRKSLRKEIENLKKSMEAVTTKLNRLYEDSPQVRLIRYFEQMRQTAE